jgi:hypothetical protein
MRLAVLRSYRLGQARGSVVSDVAAQALLTVIDICA